jgi:gamma-glutamyl hercynylcysteine S-oxide synthase
MSLAAPTAPTRRICAEQLAEARARTLLLVSTLTAEQMTQQPRFNLPSILSILQQITAYEARLLLNETPPQHAGSYDEWFDQMMDLRQRVLEQLDTLDFSGSPELADLHRQVLEHEYHCGESLLEVIEASAQPYSPPGLRLLPRGRRLADPGFMTRYTGGRVEVGGGDLSVWPAEKPAVWLTLAPFWIDVLPVTNGDYVTFMMAGGYTERAFWSEQGWEWLKGSQIQMPLGWSWQDGAWWNHSVAGDAPLDLNCPVSHVSYYEAEAFARFVGKRLPTEFEWEVAAGWDPEIQSHRHYPWGNMPPSQHVANLDQLAFGPAPVGAFLGNLSPVGCYGMIGDVWEWTSSEYTPYPAGAGVDPTIAGEAKEPKLGDEPVRVLRGGSWATRPGAIKVWSRRPSRPENRHAFNGFRCSRDA